MNLGEIKQKYKIVFSCVILCVLFGIFFFGYIQEMQINYYINVTLFFGFVASLIYGWKAVIIFGYPEEKEKLPEHANSWWVHQFWFNFVGSMLGWFFVIISIYTIKTISIEKITITHVLILILGILGVTGLLPSLISQIPNILYWLTKEKAKVLYKDEDNKKQ